MAESLNETIQCEVEKESGDAASEASAVPEQDPCIGAGTSWGSSWLKSTREKAFTTLELVKKDLCEFSDVVSSEASNFAATVSTEATTLATSAVESVKQQAHNLQWMATSEAFTTLELIKKDLCEFSDAVSSEASNLAAAVSSEASNFAETVSTEATTLANSAVESVKQQADNLQWLATSEDTSSNEEQTAPLRFPWKPNFSMSDGGWVTAFVDTVKSFAQEDTTASEDEYTELVKSSDISKNYISSELPHHVLSLLQTDKTTFLKPVDETDQYYAVWKTGFAAVDHNCEMNYLLSNCPAMREMYQELVPTQVSDSEFWQRFFYKVHKNVILENSKSSAAEAVFDATTKSDKSDGKHCDAKSSHDLSGCGSKDQNNSDRSSNIDETWSVCSSTNNEIQELNELGEIGTNTPRANSPASAKNSSADGWFNWED